MYLHCSGCGLVLPDKGLERHTPVACLGCGAETVPSIFPAAFRQLPDLLAMPTAITEGHASCFYHPQRTALVPCAACGRFLCSLCEVELAGQHWCPECLMSGAKASGDRLELERMLHDSVALSLATWPLLIFYFTLITAPATLVLCIKNWRKPTSIVRRSKWRLWVASLVAVLQLVMWAGLTVFVLVKIGSQLPQRVPAVTRQP
jgi:hypothetical protein